MIFNLFASLRNVVKACDYSSTPNIFEVNGNSVGSKISRDGWLIGTINTGTESNTKIRINGVIVAESFNTHGISATGKTAVNLYVKAGSQLNISGTASLKLYSCLP